MATLPARDSPLWKECKSTMVGSPALVRAQPTRLATITHKIYEGDTFWIDTTVAAKADGYTWYAVKTVSVVGWCASPPLTYTLAPTEPPPLPDDDTEQLPTIPDGLFSAWLSNEELQQAIVLHTQIAIANNEIAALYQAALDRGQGT